MYQIVNFKKKDVDKELNTITVTPLLDREVFLDLPIALVVFGETFTEPIIFGQVKGLPLIQEKAQVVAYLKEQEEKEKNLEEMHLATVDGKTVKVKKEKAQWSGKLPKDTDLTQLVITEQGQLEKLVKIEEVTN